jgi:hypothetical protein
LFLFDGKITITIIIPLICNENLYYKTILTLMKRIQMSFKYGECAQTSAKK